MCRLTDHEHLETRALVEDVDRVSLPYRNLTNLDGFTIDIFAESIAQETLTHLTCSDLRIELAAVLVATAARHFFYPGSE